MRLSISLAFVVVSLVLMSLPAMAPVQDTEAAAAPVTYTHHDPIVISGDSQFNASNGVVSGSGTSDDPYIIEGWEIGPMNGTIAIDILKTNAYFTIRQVHLTHTFKGIFFLQVIHGKIEQSVVDNQTVGITIYESDSCGVVDVTVSDCQLGIQILEHSTNIHFDDIHYLRNEVNFKKPASSPWEPTWWEGAICVAVLVPLLLIVGAAVYVRFFSKKPQPPPPDYKGP